MAKHAHRLTLNQKKTWRCVLPGCNYFIHIGLAHILPGKRSICWGCSEEFTLDEHALEDDEPKCSACRFREKGIVVEDVEAEINLKIALAKAGVKSVDELTRTQKTLLVALGKLPKSVLDKPDKSVEKDEIEVYEPEE
jgi:hypothetical protein